MGNPFNIKEDNRDLASFLRILHVKEYTLGILAEDNKTDKFLAIFDTVYITFLCIYKEATD